MHKSEFQEHVGSENLRASIADALERAKEIYPTLIQSHPPASGWGRRSTDFTPS
jgi:hypothetical protein